MATELHPKYDEAAHNSRLGRWLVRRRLARFHRQCDRLDIPSHVRNMALRAGFDAPDWYAG